MFLRLAVLLWLAVVATNGSSTLQVECNDGCKCSFRDNSQGSARCVTLSSDMAKFPWGIKKLTVANSPTPIEITSDFFIELGLENITTIKIVNSNISKLDVNAFRGLNYLTDVNLSNDSLILVHPDTFKSNPELEKLTLSGNPLQLTQVLQSAGSYILASDSISELSLSNCQLTHLTPGTFAELTNLDILDLSGNSLTSIHPDAFIRLEELEELDLSYNGITEMPEASLIVLQDLLELSLRGNPLKTVDVPNLPELSSLDLSKTRFSKLTITTLQNVPKLSFLNISHSNLSLIDSEAFSFLSSLRYLDLSYNQLKGPLPSFLFMENRNLETLSLAGNKNLRSLTKFNGEFVNLYLYDVSDCGLEKVNSSAFHGMHYLTTLNLSDNALTNIGPNAFLGLKSIQKVDLSHNKLHTLNSNTFASNVELNKLYISHNRFHHLTPSVFRPLQRLHIIDASYNRISSLWNSTESDIMKSRGILSKLTSLNLMGNNIKHLHITSFVPLVNLHVLDITENPIECRTSFTKAIDWFTTHRIVPNEESSSDAINFGSGLNQIVGENVDDNFETRRRWVSIVDQICPLPHLMETVNSVTSKSFMDYYRLPKIDFPYYSTPVSKYATPEVVYDEYRYNFLETNESWSALIVFGSLSLFLAFVLVNIALFMYYRSRRSYALVGYKSTFNGLPPRFPTRKGQRNAYQKLYEECSVPNPIVKNNKKLSIISVFANPTNAPVQSV